MLVAIIAVAAFAVAVSGADIGDVVYADQGDNALNIAEIMNEYFGENIVNFYYPIGNPEIESEKSNGATQENIGKKLDDIADLEIPLDILEAIAPIILEWLANSLLFF